MLKEKSVAEIKAWLGDMTLVDQLSHVEELRADGRKAVARFAESIEKAEKKRRDEKLRIAEMHAFERESRTKGYTMIAGLDEAGRGPLMGPVVAASVILPHDCEIFGLNDSKKLSESKRETLYSEILEKAVAVGVGRASHEEIDEINILNATKLAMERAIEDMGMQADCLLLDAITLEKVNLPQVSIIKGDSKSLSIAAASVIAKVTRDREVAELAKVYPEYGFEQHKGYGTAVHYDAIRKWGASPVHRKSFLKSMTSG